MLTFPVSFDPFRPIEYPPTDRAMYSQHHHLRRQVGGGDPKLFGGEVGTKYLHVGRCEGVGIGAKG